MTEAIQRSIEPLLAASTIPVRTVRVIDGPPGIDTQQHVMQAGPAMLRAIGAMPAAAVVVACFADPGVHLLREELTVPVLGIAESAYHAAIQFGHRFGIVSISEAAIGRHARYLRELSLMDRLAGDRSIGTGTAGLNEQDTIERVKDVATRLKQDDRAEVIVLGCAGLGEHRREIERHVGLPVIDPVQAAVGFAQMRVALSQ